jgi:uncharacterized protein (TIGR02118 family)
MSGKAVQSGVLYPRNKDSTFDMEYYLSTHMPLVEKHWKKQGLRSWKVAQLDDNSPYSVSCIMEWESSEAAKNAFGGDDAKEIMDDVKKFSNEHPIVIQGEIVGRSNL